MDDVRLIRPFRSAPVTPAAHPPQAKGRSCAPSSATRVSPVSCRARSAGQSCRSVTHPCDHRSRALPRTSPEASYRLAAGRVHTFGRPLRCRVRPVGLPDQHRKPSSRCPQPPALVGVFTYRSGQPFWVTLEVLSGNERLSTWVFVRDLLVDGLHRPAGEGDVRVRPISRLGQRFLVLIKLLSPEGGCTLAVSRADLANWIAETTALVPRGSEHAYFDLDAELARVFHRQ